MENILTLLSVVAVCNVTSGYQSALVFVHTLVTICQAADNINTFKYFLLSCHTACHAIDVLAGLTMLSKELAHKHWVP
jgi:hypothetical protein